jgi:hypothetical protein
MYRCVGLPPPDAGCPSRPDRHRPGPSRPPSPRRAISTSFPRASATINTASSSACYSASSGYGRSPAHNRCRGVSHDETMFPIGVARHHVSVPTAGRPGPCFRFPTRIPVAGCGAPALRAERATRLTQAAAWAGELPVAGFLGRSARTLAMPSAAGSIRERTRRLRVRRSLDGVAGERQATLSRRHGRHWLNVDPPARSSAAGSASTPTGT